MRFFLALSLLIISIYAKGDIKTEQKRILVLHSYNKSMSWVTNIDRAIYDLLEPDINNYTIHTEYMDTKRIFSKEYIQKLKNIYKLKYKDTKFDLILSSDNNAYDFLRSFRDELFGEVPVSFCGVNNFNNDEIKGLKNFTGAAENFDAKATIKAAKKLYPKGKKLLVINDHLTTGKAWKITIQKQLQEFEESLEIEYLENISIEDLQQKLQSLDDETMVLLGVYFKDKDGKYFTYEKIGQIIANSSTAPVFCLLEFNLKGGVVGGNVIGGYYQGVAQSQIGLKILNGTPASKIEIQTTGATKYIFDYLALKKYNMDMKQLPKGATVLNEPISFYKLHKSVIILSGIVIVVLLGVIFMLLINIKKRKETEKLLNESKKEIVNINEHLEEKIEEKTKEQTLLLSLFDKGDSVLFKWKNDENWSVSYVSQSISRLLGYTQKEFLDGDIVYSDCIEKSDIDRVKEEVKNGSASNKSYFRHKPYRLISKDKNIKWVLDYTIIVRDHDNNITDFIGYITDMTQERESERLLSEHAKLVAMGEMIGNIAHQWRQPLSVITTSASAMEMKSDLDNLTHEDTTKFCETILKQSNYLSSTIDDFRDFVRGDGNLVSFVLDEHLESFLNLIEGNIKDKDINIVVGDMEKIKILGFPNQLTQCYINIFNNAKDILQEKDCTKYLFIDMDKKEDNRVEIIFKDNGGGILDDVIDRIFEPYFTTKHKSRGTGLGLHMTYNLVVEGMGGFIEVNNTQYTYKGESFMGAQFKINLPLVYKKGEIENEKFI